LRSRDIHFGRFPAALAAFQNFQQPKPPSVVFFLLPENDHMPADRSVGSPQHFSPHFMNAGRIFLVALLAIAAGVVWTAQNWFYYPSVGAGSWTPEDEGLDYRDVNFSSMDGTKLHGWFIPAARNPKGAVVLQVHGNAGSLEHHLGQMAFLPREGYSVFMFDYRGYGLSEKRQPTPKGLMHDTQGAIAFLKTLPETAGQKILVIGQSIGGNNAIAAVANGAKDVIAGILLDSTFVSYSRVASYHVPLAGILMSNKYSADRHIRKLAPIPLSFIHGESDGVVPCSHSQELFELATSPKKIKLVPFRRHMEALLTREIRKEVMSFFDDCLKEKQE
jgi:fermentation-respiration switch protein FrsA (DUF1100 family)